MGPQKLHTYSQQLSLTLAIREIVYQTILYGFNTSLNEDKNTIFPPYLLNIGMNSLENWKWAQIEANKIIELNFREKIFQRHDPKQAMENHCNLLKYASPFSHQEWKEGNIIEGIKKNNWISLRLRNF